MTINIAPEDEKLIREKLRTGVFRSVEEVIHRALVSLPTPETPPQPARPAGIWSMFSVNHPLPVQS